MHLLRVQVPNFRALNQVDITFEKDFFPQIFPLGSQNGGGKSTLLQLIFVLLHCSANPDKFDFLKNILLTFEIPEGDDHRVIAKIDIDDQSNLIQLVFFCQRQTKKQEQKNNGYFWEEEPSIIPIGQYNDENENNDEDDKDDDFTFVRIRRNTRNNRILLCQIKDSRNQLIDENQNKDFLKKISEHIFLIAPSTQVFLFLPRSTTELLFKNTNYSKNYYYQLNSAKSELNNFLTYDFLAVEVLIDYFKFVRDQDFREALKTAGQYGNHYKSLLQELNQVLIDKKINLTEDFEGVTFEWEKNGKTIKLNPEDLSHGELKRLTIYTLLKYYQIKDAIVLMDEIEIALHPDWQYQIISDLEKWEPSNQYILATHSYELCQALTPAHVKEIEPKLIKNKD